MHSAFEIIDALFKKQDSIKFAHEKSWLPIIFSVLGGRVGPGKIKNHNFWILRTMSIKFRKLSYGSAANLAGHDVVYLQENNWDDYSFKTLFSLIYFDRHGAKHALGEVKIGYVGQDHGWSTNKIDNEFDSLAPEFFSLGQGAEYYENLVSLPEEIKKQILVAIGDVAYLPDRFHLADSELVFERSLLRNVSYSSVTEQFRRIIYGGVIQTPYDFRYVVKQSDDRAGIALEFHVAPNSTPSTNIHVLIGRNGIGKTFLLNGMISALVQTTKNDLRAGEFFDLVTGTKCSSGYFTSLISVSFSAFDPFTPPPDQDTDHHEMKYSYVGLKSVFEENGIIKSVHKDIKSFASDFTSSLSNCFSLATKRAQWLTAMAYLGSDDNFKSMDLERLADTPAAELKLRAGQIFQKMSSGHAIVLLTITKLVEKLAEKSLLLMDEPECHLHPPLLSAFTRAIADLLRNRNGVAIIATHSPVVLQEVPKSCVWKLYRQKLTASCHRPECETFGENVGELTREVFQLEVTKSGFHALLFESVSDGKTYAEILGEYNDEIGFEGKAVLRALINERDRAGSQI